MKQIIKRISLGLLIIVVLVTTLATGATLQRDYGVNPPKNPAPIDLHQLFGIINQERAEIHHQPLLETSALDAAAAAHCMDMVRQDYYAHTNPEGIKPNAWIDAQHVGYLMWAENINHGYINAQQVANEFYASPDHRTNILFPTYDEIGLAECNPKGYPNMVVEQFVQASSTVL